MTETFRLLREWRLLRKSNQNYQGLFDEAPDISAIYQVVALAKGHALFGIVPKIDILITPARECNEELERSIACLRKIDKGGEMAEKLSSVLRRDVFVDIERLVKMRIENFEGYLQTLRMYDTRQELEEQRTEIEDLGNRMDRLVATCNKAIRENDKRKVRCVSADQERRGIAHGLQDLPAKSPSEGGGITRGSTAVTEQGSSEQVGNKNLALTVDDVAAAYEQAFKDVYGRQVHCQSTNQEVGRVQNELPNSSAESSSSRRTIQIGGFATRQEASGEQNQPPSLGQTSPDQEAWDNATSGPQPGSKKKKKKKKGKKK
ncbi:MAG: hypothetical protein Q9160_002699 [Pyrenula sp. 1 TL-2023]